MNLLEQRLGLIFTRLVFEEKYIPVHFLLFNKNLTQNSCLFKYFWFQVVVFVSESLLCETGGFAQPGNMVSPGLQTLPFYTHCFGNWAQITTVAWDQGGEFGQVLLLGMHLFCTNHTEACEKKGYGWIEEITPGSDHALKHSWSVSLPFAAALSFLP